MSSSLPRSVPEAEGVDSSAILALMNALTAARLETHSLMILRHGKVIAEGWWNPYSPKLPHMLYSLSKSFTSTAIGLAVHEGLLSVDDAVIKFFTEDLPAEVTPGLAAMQVRHLLTMSTGHAVEPTNHMLMTAETWVKGFFDQPLDAAPGTHFVYNTGATYMLAAILAQVTGETLVDYLRPRLFAPLGIDNPQWQMSPQGIATGGFGLAITTEDIARFGQLYLQQGVWQGEQLIPEAWVEEATAKQIENGNGAVGSDWGKGYGYQFWRCQVPGAYRGDGAFGQYCLVLPEQEMVVALTSAVQEMQPTLDLVWKHLVPAVHGTSTVAAPSVHSQLTSTLARLAIAPVKGDATAPVAGSISGVRWTLEENPRGIEIVALELVEGGRTLLHIKWAHGDEVIPVGFGAWAEGTCRSYGAPPLYEPMRVVASGGWISPDTYALQLRLVETPHWFNVSLRFVNDTLVFTNQINMTLRPCDTPVLMGKRAR